MPWGLLPFEATGVATDHRKNRIVITADAGLRHARLTLGSLRGAVESDGVVERVLQLFESMGYPRQGTDWLRRKRGWVIVVLAILAWVAVLAFCSAFALVAMEVVGALLS